MIHILDGMPDGLLGVETVGKLTAEDYTNVLGPALDEEDANFGRWPWPPVDRHDTNWPHNYLVSARRRLTLPRGNGPCSRCG